VLDPKAPYPLLNWMLQRLSLPNYKLCNECILCRDPHSNTLSYVLLYNHSENTRQSHMRLAYFKMTDSSSKMELEDEAVHVALTYDHLDVVPIMNRVRSPKAGAIVLFAGEVYSTMSL
jgi:hypothetical protein